MKLNKRSRLPSLAKGQLWKMEDKNLEIMEVGKTLTHYRLFSNQKRVPISLGGIQTVQDFLRNNKAELVRPANPPVVPKAAAAPKAPVGAKAKAA
jgi:hypothetical protein